MNRRRTPNRSAQLIASLCVLAACALPAAAAPALKWNLLVVIDRMTGTTRVPLEQTINGQRVSLVDIFRAAGVGLRIVEGDEIPRRETLERSELHNLMQLGLGEQPRPGEIKIKILIVNMEVGQPGLYGVMFDYGQDDADGMPRQGLAVFELPHQSLAGGVGPEMLLTITHELTHIFNIHHSDWDGTTDYAHGATVEGYSYTDSVQWKLSAASLDHLLGNSCPERLVRPGPGGLAFGLITQAHSTAHRPPLDYYEIVARDPVTGRRATSRTLSIAPSSSREAPSGFTLSLASPKSDYAVGEAITVTAALSNSSGEPTKVLPFINPEYRALLLTIKGPGDEAPVAYLPPFLLDTRAPTLVTLAPGASLVTEAKLFFGAEGWNFQKPGEYVIEAMYKALGPASDSYVKSPPLSFKVFEPFTAPSRRARDLLSTEGKLGTSQGLFLYMLGGGSGLNDTRTRLKQLLEEAPGSDQAPDVRVALAGDALLAPTLTSPISVARLREARELLRAAHVPNRVAPTALLRTQAALADAFASAGLMAEANAERAAVRELLQRQIQLRALDRRSIQDRL